MNYRVLDSADRAMTKKMTSLMPCDYKLKADWYRFDGKAGNAIANKCVPAFHCGTLAPGWMEGSHPTVGEGVVRRRACFNQFNNCCNKNIEVKVRNCGSFFVYKLLAAPSCQLRYCGNGQGEICHVILD